MDIIVCGAQAPFVRGGAEFAMDNLVGALGEAGHRADLVRLPVAWDKDRMFDSALAWRSVPLDADLVIATNFPSYFAVHPRKVVWLFHQNRGAYDAIDEPWSDLGLDDISLEAQRLMSEWDVRALREAERRFAISKVVSDRLARFSGLVARPLYHPPPLAGRLKSGPFDDYVFCPTRMETNKRVDRLIDAMAASSGETRGVVVGRGTQLEALRARAAGSRCELPGFVSDEDLIDLYSRCLAVVYAPHDEDYGYVTLQAFLSGKPVITSADSGGVLEWVEDGVNGFVTDGSPDQMGAAIDVLAADPERARVMGLEGRSRVAGLSWPAAVAQLVGS